MRFVFFHEMKWLSEQHVQQYNSLREVPQGLLQRSPEQHVRHQREAHTSSCIKETSGHVKAGREGEYLEHVLQVGQESSGCQQGLILDESAGGEACSLT